MDGRVLADLKVAELRRELEKRQKDKFGVKQVLVDRLKEALEEDGHDPLTYRFVQDSESPLEGDTTEQSVCCRVSLCDLTSVQSINGDEVDASSHTKDDTSVNRNEQVPAETVNEEQTEQKKITEESVTYVVQVGDQEEDLDYDLKADNNGQVENCEQKGPEKTPTKESNPAEESAESAKPSKTGLEDRKNLWVSNLPKSVKAADLKQHFSKAGKVVSATVVISTRSPGGCYGFLQMASAQDAANAARYFDCSEYNGHKISVEATERKSPTLTSKLNTSNARTSQDALAKKKVTRPSRRPLSRFSRFQMRGRSSWARRARYARRNLELRRVAPREPVTESRREPPRLTRPPPPRMNPRLLAYQSLKRASLLLAAARYGSSRSAHPREPLPPRYSSGPRSPPQFSRLSSGFERPSLQRYSSPDRRSSRPTEPSRRAQLRMFYAERRRSMTQAYESDRSRPISPPPMRSMPPRRSEPVSRDPPPRMREPLPPTDRRRSVPAPARSFDSYARVSKVTRPPAESSRSFNRPSDPPRIEGRSSYERMEYSRPQANGMRQPPSPLTHQFSRESERYRSPYETEMRRPSPGQGYSSRPQATPPRRDYRDVSRSPPRSRNMALMRPYPDSSPHHDMRMDHPIRDRSPMGYNSGLRPKVVDYGHRSEPRDNYPWRGESPRIQTPPGHTWKPAGHSFVSNYGGRGARRY